MIDAINPTAKTIGLLVGSILLGVTFQWQTNVLLALIGFLFLLTSNRTSLNQLVRFLLPILLISASYFFTGWLFHSEENLLSMAVDTMTAAENPALLNGVTLSTRLLAFAMLGLSFSLTTDSNELVYSFIQQAKMPMKMGYAILTALNLTSLISQEYKKSKLALQVRNLPVRPFDTKPLFTMMVRMVRWSDRLSLAMESKGFSEQRTMKQQMKVRPRDIVFMIGFPLAIVGLNLLFS
ncbi:energy-coupling factor transporter transmembrane component T family protein [Atopococcus tabaci]|uniref:energy-coupling factor transporter transmembrane component T family protein n=1 Tax=Atopococcus tabaci TaxID=269774 RepID=UPI00240A1801|nr:energy-coupling factor transporter transmembrane component T [Atopococcus tabaci]